MGSTRLRRYLSILFWDSDSIAPSRRFEIIVFLQFSFWDSEGAREAEAGGRGQLSILFLRFRIATLISGLSRYSAAFNSLFEILYVNYVSTCIHYRYNRHVSLSILFLRFGTGLSRRIRGFQSLTFNSLFEIPFLGRILMLLGCIRLSILFLRFFADSRILSMPA